MRSKETYATSGPRIKLRLFGGYNYSADMLGDANMVSKAYARGVPMGGELSASQTAPSFLVWAMRDPRNAPLQRLQMIKVWHDGGKAQEKLYDIACSDGLSVDPTTHRCPVLENPSCRWNTWDAIKAGVERAPDLPPTLQERAYSSAIWYN